MKGPPRIIQSLINSGEISSGKGPVELLQTQMSWVILTGNYAYKLKKPVNLGYLDYTSLKKRHHFCDKEVELNRRLCPQGYLGVVPVKGSQGNYKLGGTGRTVDYAVKMLRLPRERMLDVLLEHGKATPAMLEQVAERLAGFHSNAETNAFIGSFGNLDCITTNTNENFDQSGNYVGFALTRARFDHIKQFSLAFLHRYKQMLEQRIESGRIRDCHGDLHSAHICFTSDLCIYDCIEFNDRFRYSDVASEIAFLAMDLDFHGRADLAWTFVDTYIRLSGDRQIGPLLNFYKCYRAMVRAKVNCFQTDDRYLDNRQKERAAKNARAYFQLAESYTRQRPLLLVNVGLVGSGKTTLAKLLGRRLGMVVISSDVVRKKLAGIGLKERRPEKIGRGIYSASFSRLTYETMFSQASQWLKRGVSVILDATFTMAASRQKAWNLAFETGADLYYLEYRISDALANARLKGRQKRASSISDAGPEVYTNMKKEFEPLTGTQAARRVIIDSSEKTEQNIQRVLERI